MLVEARDLGFTVQRPATSLKILRNVSFGIAEGEFVAVQGPSGSGKTTLLHILGTLLRPTSGEVRIGGVNPYSLTDLQLAHFRAEEVGFIFQQFHVFPNLSLIENILLPTNLPFEAPGTLRNEPARAIELARQIGLAERLDHYPHQLSGGQLQRLVIARALMRQPKILFADEPTGNLDSKTARDIIGILQRLNEDQGQTIVLVTHDLSIAAEAARKIVIVDGRVQEDTVQRLRAPTRGFKPLGTDLAARGTEAGGAPIEKLATKPKHLSTFALQNIRHHLRRSLLTMLGIFVGIAATFFLGSLGSFVQKKVIESYRDLGVSAFRFHAYPSWPPMGLRKALPYAQLSMTRDIEPMLRLFPEVELFSPLYINWNGGKVIYGGKSLDENTRIFGVSADFFKISSWAPSEGKVFSSYHEANMADVCILGATLRKKLFANDPPIGTLLEIQMEQKTSVCRVMGVLSDRKMGSQWDDPNNGLFVPYTSFINFTAQRPRFMNFLARVREGTDVGQVAGAMEEFYKKKYGTSGDFMADKNSLLLVQMQKFTNLMRILLLAISIVCLSIGGVGLMNMMLVSVSERLAELGLLRALGASAQSLAKSVLIESMFLCSAAGVLGVAFGFCAFHGGLWLMTKVVPKLNFEWHVDWSALFLSISCMAIVALLSAYLPAKRAGELEVLHAIKGRAD